MTPMLTMGTTMPVLPSFRSKSFLSDCGWETEAGSAKKSFAGAKRFNNPMDVAPAAVWKKNSLRLSRFFEFDIFLSFGNIR